MIGTLLRYTRFGALLFLLATAFIASRQAHAVVGNATGEASLSHA